MKMALVGIPLFGGNYTLFNYLSDGLTEYNWTLLEIGKSDFHLIRDDLHVNIGKNLDRLSNTRFLAKQLLRFLVEKSATAQTRRLCVMQKETTVLKINIKG